MDHQLPEPDAGDFPIVQTRYGPVQGRRCLDYNGNPYYSFVRVPYSVAPVAEQRFSYSSRRNVVKWNDDEPLNCTYNRETDPPFEFSEENCLYCNIYTPLIPNETTSTSSRRPILVFIPAENATLSHRYDLEKYGPEYFMTESIVLIVVSYRSGILGFAKVQDKNLEGEVPGYSGYYDICSFFKWLKHENTKFGGSDENTTVFGQGSGASLIVDSLYKSKRRGGFSGVNRIILHSVNDCTWLGPNDINIKEYAMFARWANAEQTEREVLEMLRAMPVDELVSFEQQYLKKTKFRSLSFHFMTRLRRRRHFSERDNAVMIGFNSNEGIMDKIHFNKIDSDSRDIEKLLKFIWLPNNTYVGDLIRTRLIPKIENYFYEDAPTREKYMQIVSDLNHNIETLMLARLMPRTFGSIRDAPLRFWLYRFDVDGRLNLVKKLNGVEYSGACFGDELGYLFKVPNLPAVERGSLEDLTIRRMVKLWTNFARHGTPNPNPNCPTLGNTGWEPLARDPLVSGFGCLNIGANLEFNRDKPELLNLAFWYNLWKPYTNQFFKGRGVFF